MLRDVTIRIAEEMAGKRLDRLVLDVIPGARRSAVARAFERGAVTAEGRLLAKGDRAVAGMEVGVSWLHESQDGRATPEEGFLDAIFEDEALIAFNKPGGQNCHPLEFGETGSLVNAMLARYPEVAAVGDDPRMPALLHRIDSGTSGLVIAARTQKAFTDVRRQFSGHRVIKTYRALVEGLVRNPGGIVGYLAHTPGDRGRMRGVSLRTVPRGERALRAETFYRPIRLFPHHTLLDVTIRTGVTHQIRCQLAELGHPIVGDITYGAAPGVATGMNRHLLHSLQAVLKHPESGREIALTAPLAADFLQCLERLAS